MKKLLSLLLLLALLVTCAGCTDGQTNDPTLTAPTTDSTTAPAETTVPPETTPPPETTEATEPPETTELTPTTLPQVSASSGDLYIDEETAARLPSEEELAECQFEAWYGAPWLDGVYKYGYIGESGTITTPGGGLTIELPQEWIQDLTIVWAKIDDGRWRINVASTELLRAVAADRENIAPEDVDRSTLIKHIRSEFSIEIYATNGMPPWDDVENMCENYCYLGKDETYTYVAITPDGLERLFGTWSDRVRSIEALGEDTYYDLLGDLVITEEMAKEMITIVNPISE